MILVTGATGKIGQELVMELKAAGARFGWEPGIPQRVTGMDAVALRLRPARRRSPEPLRGWTPVPPDLGRDGARDRRRGRGEEGRGPQVVKLSVWGAEEDAFVIGRRTGPWSR